MASLKALTLASVAVLALSRFATAADLLPPPPEPPPPIAAPEFGGWYLRGDVGIAGNAQTPTLVNNPDPLAGGGFGAGANETFNNTTLSSSALADVGVGYQVNNWFRADVTGEYRDGGHLQSLYVLNNPNGGAGNISQLLDFYRANTQSYVGLVNAYGNLGTWYGVSPFVGAGVGVARTSVYGMTDQGQVSIGGGGTGPSGGYFSDGSRTNFAWALMAGLDFNITQNLKLELGYRYLNMGKISSGPSNCANGTGAGSGFSIADCGGSSNYVRSTSTLASNDFRVGLLWTLGGDTPVYAPPPQLPLVRKY
jgi:opacity protein-like surface antigen